jgi:hypothetical protein
MLSKVLTGLSDICQCHIERERKEKDLNKLPASAKKPLGHLSTQDLS